MKVVSKYSEVLNDLLLDNNMTITDLSKVTGISKGLLSISLRGISIPTIKNLIKIANYFNCSLDYLLGRSENMKRYPEARAGESFYNRLMYLLSKNHIKYYELQKGRDLPKSKYFWKKGSMPLVENLITIAEYFNVSIDYLLGLTDEE